jgi:hypothetical protein
MQDNTVQKINREKEVRKEINDVLKLNGFNLALKRKGWLLPKTTILNFLLNQYISQFILAEPKTNIAPMLAVDVEARAKEYYKQAFSAEEL